MVAASMKILVLTSGVLPDTHSGLAKVAYFVPRELQRMGHEVVILTRRYHPDCPLSEEVDGMRYYRIPYPDRWGVLNVFWPLVAAWQSMRWQRKIKRLHQNFDVVWVLNPWWTLFLNPKRLWPKAKVIFEFICNPRDEIVANNGRTVIANLFGGLYNSITKRCMKKSDSIFVLSRFAQADAQTMVGKNIVCKTTIVPGGVDVQAYNLVTVGEKWILKEKLDLPQDRPIFITARGLKGRTGVDKLVQAAGLLKKNDIPFYLVIIGKGPMKSQIETQVECLGLCNNVRLVSDLSEEALIEYYQASDVFILPTQAAEAFGLATVEALSIGLIAFGTDNGATPEILQRYHHDWLIRGCEAEDIFQKMQAYCTPPERYTLPPETIRDLTRKHFDWSVASHQFLQYLKAAI